MKDNIFRGCAALLFAVFAALPAAALAGEAQIIALGGSVQARLTSEGDWVKASKGLSVPEGGAIRTKAGGAAVVLLPNKTKIWLKESTRLEIEQRQTFATRLALLFGRIKARVPHLMRQERFEVRTPSAVCAVRGTEFTMGTSEDGKMDLKVLFGEVNLRFNVPPAVGPDRFDVPQGEELSSAPEGKPNRPVLLTAKAESEALENWDPGLTPEERTADLVRKENDRAQIREFAAATQNAEAQVRSFLNVVKESDLAAGRTLTDVHGNLVRVDQRLLRPAPDQIQFFNLVKRQVYNNDGSSAQNGGFAYNGGQVMNRLDYMQMTMAFNQALPQRLEDWPGFFDKNSVKPSWASFVTANRTDASQIFFAAEGYKYDQARDELVNNPGILTNADGSPLPATSPDDRETLITGVLNDDTGAGGTGISAVQGLSMISKLQVADSGAGNGTLVYKDAASHPVDGTGAGTASDVVWAVQTANLPGYESKGSDTVSGDGAPLWQYQADMYDIGNQQSTNAGEYLWFAKENYGISNNGAIKTVGDLTDSGQDPFTVLKNSALESVMYIKKSIGNDPAALAAALNPSQIPVAALTPAQEDVLKNDISGDDYFSYGSGGPGMGTNIDVVFIPDLAVAAVQRMLPAITSLKN